MEKRKRKEESWLKRNHIGVWHVLVLNEVVLNNNKKWRIQRENMEYSTSSTSSSGGN